MPNYHIEKLEKIIGNTPELIALKQIRDEALAEIQPDYQQTQREQEERRRETNAAALDFQRKATEQRNRETCQALGLNYFSVYFSSPEERTVHDELRKKDNEFRAPILNAIVQAHVLKTPTSQYDTDRPRRLFHSRLLNECLPLISIDQAVARIQEEALGFVWLPAIKVIDFLQDTDNKAIQLLLEQSDFSTINNGMFFETINKIDGFNQIAYHAIKKYNQKVLESTGLDGLSIDSWKINSAHVNRGLVPLQDVLHTRTLSAEYAAQQRRADQVYNNAMEPLLSAIATINKTYEVGLEALVPRKAAALNTHAYHSEKKPEKLVIKPKTFNHQTDQVAPVALAPKTVPALNTHDHRYETKPEKLVVKSTPFNHKTDDETERTDFDVFQYCLDYDGCTDNPDALTALVEHIVTNALKNKKCTRIVLSIASRRQSLYIDFVNAMAHYNHNKQQWLSAATMLSTLENLLSVAIVKAYQQHRPDVSPPVIELNPLLTFDVFNHLRPGDTYRLMTQTHRYASFYASSDPVALWVDNELDEPVCLFRWMKPQPLYYPTERSIVCDDPLKTLTHYMFAHHAALTFPGKKIRLIFVDNLVTLLEHAASVVQSRSQAFPESCYFQGIQLDVATKTMGHFKTAIIQGTGAANPQWQEDLRKIACQYPTTLTDVSTHLILRQLNPKPTADTLMLNRLLNAAADEGARNTVSSAEELSQITANLPSITFFAPWLSKPLDGYPAIELEKAVEGPR